jgi:tellurite resistance protein
MTPAEAFAAIALAAVACDGSVDPREATLLRIQLDQRHPYMEWGQLRMGHLFDQLLLQLQADGWQALVSRAIPALSASQQETALAMAAHLVHGDRSVSPEESGLLLEMATLMRLPDGRAEQILDVISVLHRDNLEL